ncbi:MAG: hypothetical protein E6Q97_14025 [Desulfurellales bacterium]|nr:MAG: hypothetical protein E6Q97_14025 [Desulfurellales bacterium]
MIAQFVPTGRLQDTTKALPQIGPVVGPYTIPVIGNEGLAGSLTSGNLGYQVVGEGGAYLVWMDKEEVLDRWEMNDAAAVTDAIDGILTELAASTAAVTVTAAGVVTAVA